MAKNHALQRWGVEDSVELYGIRTWGAGFFDVSENGEVVVCPHGAKGPQIPLLEIIAGLHERGYDMPVLLRVENILSSRIAHIHESFRKAIRELGYKGDYRGVF
ncbi:MAG: arginine decarboxylase, partial [Desulfovibrio sp.]|nr:arginine decarboxylase [Desulfovibrio sp.]